LSFFEPKSGKIAWFYHPPIEVIDGNDCMDRKQGVRMKNENKNPLAVSQIVHLYLISITHNSAF
jgi:hypothetical protein